MSMHNIPLSIQKRKSPKIIPNRILSAFIGFPWSGTQERARNIRGKQAISVGATEVLLYVDVCVCM